MTKKDNQKDGTPVDEVEKNEEKFATVFDFKQMLNKKGKNRLESFPFEKVHIAPLDKFVYACGMTLREKDKFESEWITFDNDGKPVRNQDNVRAKLIVKCVCDEEGKRIFKDEDADDIVGNLPAGIMDSLFKACQKVNGMGAEAKEEVKKTS
jgi:hypothetical protein